MWYFGPIQILIKSMLLESTPPIILSTTKYNNLDTEPKRWEIWFQLYLVFGPNKIPFAETNAICSFYFLLHIHLLVLRHPSRNGPQVKLRPRWTYNNNILSVGETPTQIEITKKKKKKGETIYLSQSRNYHWVTFLVNSTGGFADMELGSALAMMSVYESENLGSFEVTINPVEVTEPCWENFKDISVSLEIR